VFYDLGFARYTRKSLCSIELDDAYNGVLRVRYLRAI